MFVFLAPGIGQAWCDWLIELHSSEMIGVMMLHYSNHFTGMSNKRAANLLLGLRNGQMDEEKPEAVQMQFCIRKTTLEINFFFLGLIKHKDMASFYQQSARSELVVPPLQKLAEVRAAMRITQLVWVPEYF